MMQRGAGILFLLVSSCLLSVPVYSQGCSDAGFCTMGAMRPDQAYSGKIDLKLRSLEVNFYRGKSLLTPTIYATILDFNFSLNNKNFIQIKVPYQTTTGSLGTLSGMGDLSLSFTHSLKTSGKGSLNGTIGTKIPLGDGNATVNNKFTGGQDAAPHMYYQPSLGSFDAIAGLSWINGDWLFATGIQMALTRNKNQFVWSNFPDYPNPNYVQSYNRGTQLKRGTDVMLRVERNFRFTNWNVSIGALPIWRITPDKAKITDEDRIKDETTGLALSMVGSFGYQFDVNNSIKFIHGHKFVDRNFNPDGLSRKTVNSISYIYKFR